MASTTSGTGSVSTMWLEETVRRLRRGGRAPLAGPTATTAVPAADARVLVDPHPAAEQPLAQPEREPGGLHRRPGGDLEAAGEQRRVAARADLGGGERDDPLTLDRAHELVLLPRCGVDDEV